ncbi:MAG: ATP-dependent protease ATPase subunit HslU [Bacteroidia bacterium]
MLENALTPSKIVEELDKYIIGQDDAKKAVAIALRNRWRRMNAKAEFRSEIIPNNILMIGATGVGKTEIARRLAQLAQAPFVKVEASKFTEVGYVGRDVESMVRDLVEQAINLVTAEQKEKVKAKATETANEQILDLLLPENTASSMLFNGIGGEGSIGFGANDNHESAREEMRNQLTSGELEEKDVEIEMDVPAHKVQVMGPMGVEGLEGLEDMLSNMVPKKRKKRKMTVAEARAHFIEEEADRLIDMDNVTREALDRASNSGIIFIDEIDKIAAKGAVSGADVSREGVQRDLLPVVEGSAVNTKHGTIKTDHILFVAAGAFHVSKPSDLIPELQGRFPIRVELNALTKDDFVKILSQPRNALTKQYQALLESEGVTISFDNQAIEAIADIAFSVNQQIENIGARRLHTIMSNLLNEILFEVPDKNDSEYFAITANFVYEKVGKLAAKKELSHYIL